MATLALAAVGAAVGGALLPAGVTVLGATLTGAAIGAQLGAFAGSFVDQALMGGLSGGQTLRGPRLSDLHVTASTEGAPLPRIYGRARLGGQIIWADEIEERSKSTSTGGKGLGSGPTTVTYSYFASFAVAVAEGEITSIGRIWADGNELELSDIEYRIHAGSETQEPDELLVARLGAQTAPAFRGVAYIVFERLPLKDFGNRVPQLSFEVFRDVDGFGALPQAVVLIPGSGEFALSPTRVSSGAFGGASEPLNVHTVQGGTDWAVSLDQMQQALPSVQNVSLVVSWFGTDLRAAHCQIRPGVDAGEKVTFPQQWGVGGVSRSGAHLISQIEGRPSYGGTPSDSTVIAAIADLKARGYQVTLTPFVLMDIPPGNGSPDPYSGASSQPSYPWRGRITCDPAPGTSDTVDSTAAAATQISNLVGGAQPGDFSIAGGEVNYSGPAEWSFRRMVLHYAHLAVAAGGVDTFVIGTELRGLTWVRSGPGTYPFVAALADLANDVRAVLGPATKITYAADWSEYFGHQPGDGSGDLYFHLDPLWSSASIDAVGIDLYWPLSDWRDGFDHLDALGGARSIYDLGYLAGNVAGGEGFDWYYASAADRDGQIRTPVTDGAHGKPWVYRYKDVKSWWSEQHFDRPGGTESATPTSWVPQSKPVWFMEIGCPAVDKGANQPNVFVDPKSSENALPYYSSGDRDDLMQRAYLSALMGAFDPDSEHYVAESNPASAIYAGRMVDTSRMYVYCWDARPFPAFPGNGDIWGDGANWRLGHWLNGRTSSVGLSALIERMMSDFEFSDFDARQLDGIVSGYVVDRVMSLRDALQPLTLGWFFDGAESGGTIVFRHRGGVSDIVDLTIDDLVEERADDPLLTLVRGQETEMPRSAKVAYIGGEDDYRQQVAESRRLIGGTIRVSQAELPVVLEAELAGRIADTWLHEIWSARERVTLSLPPSRLALEPGDAVRLETEAGTRLLRVTEVADRGSRRLEARSLDTSIYRAAPAAVRPGADPVEGVAGPALLHFVDLPLLRGDEKPEALYAAARQTPWAGGVAVYRSPEESGFALATIVTTPATIGETLSPLGLGPEGRMDLATRLIVRIAGEPLSSLTRLQMLSGRNAIAVRSSAGLWEVLQFESAELMAPETYELSGLLRGQAGTSDAMEAGAAAGSALVVLDEALASLPTTIDDIGLAYRWRYGPASRAIGDDSYAETVHASAGRGFKPYAPVHVRGWRDPVGAGDLQLTWVRRTRIGGDSWDVAEVPLGEEGEAYEVDILDGPTVVRTLSSSTAQVVYAASDQIDDFGAPQPSCQVRVYQMSGLLGRGCGRNATV